MHRRSLRNHRELQGPNSSPNERWTRTDEARDHHCGRLSHDLDGGPSGERAKLDDSKFENHPLVALKSVLIREWRDSRSGSLTAGGELQFAPSFPEAQRVQQWWQHGGAKQELVDLSKATSGGEGASQFLKNLVHTDLEGLQQAASKISGTQPEWYSVVTRLALVQTRKQGEVQPLVYLACQEPREGSFKNQLLCNKRVGPDGFCPSCNKVTKNAPRLNIRCRFSDAKEQAWLTTFHDAAVKVLGMSGEEVYQMEKAAEEKGKEAREELDEVIKRKYFAEPMNLTVRVKLDTYNGEMRPNISVTAGGPVDKRVHARQMLKEINTWNQSLINAGA